MFLAPPSPGGSRGRVRIVISLRKELVLGRFRPGSGGKPAFVFILALSSAGLERSHAPNQRAPVPAPPGRPEPTETSKKQQFRAVLVHHYKYVFDSPQNPDRQDSSYSAGCAENQPWRPHVDLLVVPFQCERHFGSSRFELKHPVGSDIAPCQAEAGPGAHVVVLTVVMQEMRFHHGLRDGWTP